MTLNPQERLHFFFDDKLTANAIEAGRNAFCDYSTRNSVQLYNEIYIKAAADYGSYLRFERAKDYTLDRVEHISAVRCILAFPALDQDRSDIPADLRMLYDTYIPELQKLPPYGAKTSLFEDVLPKVFMPAHVRHALVMLGVTAFRDGVSIDEFNATPMHDAIMGAALNSSRALKKGYPRDMVRLHLATMALAMAPADPKYGENPGFVPLKPPYYH